MIQVRAAQATDAETISTLSAEVQALHARALPELFKPADASSFPPAAVRGLLRDQDWVFLVACVDAAVVGYASAQIQRRAETSIRHAQSTLSIQWLGVKAEWRRRGVGRALIEAVRNEAERLDLAALLLDVWSFNAEARGFYDAMGFRSQREILSLDVRRPRGASI